MNSQQFKLMLMLIFLSGGIAAGLAFSTAVGGSATDDPCLGHGNLEATRKLATDSGDKAYYDGRTLGAGAIVDADTEKVVDVSLYEQEVADYYQQHPDENPVLIADKTADAAFAEGAFTTVPIPSPNNDTTCLDGSKLVNYPGVAAAICLPDSWTLKREDEAGVVVRSYDGLVEVGIFPKGVSGTAGTRCARPQLVPLEAGEARVCAFNVDPFGAQGHGIVLPGGRELGMNVFKGAPDVEIAFAFRVAFSVSDQ